MDNNSLLQWLRCHFIIIFENIIYTYSFVMKTGFTFVLVHSTLLFGINYRWLSQNFNYKI